ncbi:MAG: TonB-dependent receptor [Candidatus Aminicenantes bacterium]|nr:MAG: TonB-dependent receptor [Candidatus Aminicenantes bacterium]
MNNPKRIKKLFPCLALLTIALFLMSGNMMAQTTYVTVNGTITDDEGTLLPGASVTIRNVQTGLTKSTVTQTDGRYSISGLVPGQYEIEVSLSGFTTTIRKGLTFSVGARLTINLTLTTAAIEEEVTVTAESPMVEVTKSEVAAVIERRKIDSLPLYDRSFSDLTIIKAGVAGDRSNAQPLGSEEILIDGVSNEWVGRNTTNMEIPADAIQEFRVMTNQYEAEYGNASGMIRSAITRSGTNEMHGRLAFFYRDEVFDDVNYFVKHDEYKGPELPDWEKAPFSHYNYSGFIGGPLKKDKAHFFLAYDGLTREEATTITSPLVEKQTIPYTQQRHQILFKFNYQFSEKNLISFRYGLNRPTLYDACVGGMYTLSTSYNFTEWTHDGQFNWTYYPSDNTMNEVRMLYSYNTYLSESSVDNDAFFIARPSGYFGTFGNYPQEVPTKRYQFVDNFSLFLGDHSVKFGVDASYVHLGGYVQQYVPGYYLFTTDEPFDPANFATYPLLLIKSPKIADIDSPYWEVGFFAQDSWKVTPRLTLNFGLRYNYYTVQFIDIKQFDIRHLNPRFGFSYDPVGDGKTSIRGGIGTYSQNPQLNLGLLIGLMDQLVVQYIYYPGYPDPSVPNPFITGPSVEPPLAKYQGEPDSIAPYTVQTTFGFQREFVTDLSIGIDLVWSKGMKFSRIEDDNAVIPGTSYIRPDMTKSSIFVFRMKGKSDYRGMFITLSKRYSHGWSLDIAYTLSRSWSDVESEQTGPYDQDEGNWGRMYGPNNGDATHRLVVSGIFELPLGFQLSGLAYYRSATPWTAFYQTDVNLDGSNTDMLGDHRNDRRGFDFFNLNIRFSKFIRIDRFRLQFFAEVYNLTSRDNFGSPFFRYGTEDFGNPTSAGDPRRIQFGARIDF